jgi:hypothetical protein
MKGGEYIEDLDVDGSIIWKTNFLILEKLDLKAWSHLARVQSMMGFCEHGNKPSLSNQMGYMGVSRRITLSWIFGFYRCRMCFNHRNPCNVSVSCIYMVYMILRIFSNFSPNCFLQLVMKNCSVFCEVGTEFLNITKKKFVLFKTVWRRGRIPPPSPARHRRRRKGSPVPGGITRPPCSWGI